MSKRTLLGLGYVHWSYLSASPVGAFCSRRDGIVFLRPKGLFLFGWGGLEEREKGLGLKGWKRNAL